MYFGFDLKPALPFAVLACVAAKLASVPLCYCYNCRHWAFPWPATEKNDNVNF